MDLLHSYLHERLNEVEKRQSDRFIHGDTRCTECGDDAELHELKRARDLIRARRQDEVSEAGWQAVERALAYATKQQGVAMDAF